MLEAILENIPVGLAVTEGSPDYAVARISQNGQDFDGQQAGGRSTYWKFYLPDQAAQLSPEDLPLYRASRFGEETRNLELIMETQEGRKIPVLVNAAPIRDVQGNIVSAISTWLDITDRKSAEEKLQASEALYRIKAESAMPLPIFICFANYLSIISNSFKLLWVFMRRWNGQPEKKSQIKSSFFSAL